MTVTTDKGSIIMDIIIHYFKLLMHMNQLFNSVAYKFYVHLEIGIT
jgi:hypothetical protein